MSSPVTSTKRLGLGLVVAAALLLLAEAGARLVRGAPEAYLVVEEHAGPDFLRRGDLVEPAFQGPFAVPPFPAEPAGPRVVFLGASTLRAGTPSLESEQEFPSLVGQALGIEALNLGDPGATAEDLVARLPAVLELQPSSLVVYSGHNAFVEASTKGLGDEVEDARLVAAVVRRSRLILLLSDHVGAARLAEPSSSHALGEAERARVRAAHLSAIGELVSASTVPVVLVTLVSNPFAAPIADDCPEVYEELGVTAPHFGAEAKPPNLQGVGPEQTLAWSERCEQGRYLHARAVWEAGGVEEAGPLLDAIRDEESLPLRADRATNEGLRAVEGVVLVDADRAFREAGMGLEPALWWHDAVHPNAAGHEALAALVAPAVAEQLGQPDPGLALPSTAPR